MISRTLDAEVEYEVIEVEGRTFPATQWCIKTFGPASSRWFMAGHTFYFRNSRDATLFQLIWCCL